MGETTAILVTEFASNKEGAIPIHIPRTLLQKRRWRATAENGTELAADLPKPAIHGTLLKGGNNTYQIHQKPEEVIVIPLPDTPSMAAKIGWYLGNRHLPIAVQNDEMLVELFPTLTDSLDRIGIPYTQRTDVLRVRAHSSAHRH